MNHPILLALYLSVTCTFVVAFMREGVSGKRMDMRASIVVIAAGILWPLTVTTAFALTMIDALRKKEAS